MPEKQHAGVLSPQEFARAYAEMVRRQLERSNFAQIAEIRTIVVDHNGDETVLASGEPIAYTGDIPES